MSEPLPPPTPIETSASEKVSFFRRDVPKRVTVSSLLVSIVFATFLVIYTLSLPSGFGVVAPGPVVRLTGAPTGTAVIDDGSGERGWLAFTTVNIEELTYLETISARLSDRPIVRLGERTADSPALAQMESAKEVAAALALMSTGAPVPSPEGILVLDVDLEAPAARAGIKPGDVIFQVEGIEVSLPAELKEIITASETVTLNLRREDTEFSVSITPQKGRIGVEVVPSYADSLTELMNIDTAAVGGPSAGLMLTLAYIDALSPGDLTAGRRVAGTGSIDPLGLVGEIAGLRYKVVAAAEAGAEVFFVPASQESLTGERPSGIEFVSVETFVDALRYLCDAGATDEICTEVLQ